MEVLNGDSKKRKLKMTGILTPKYYANERLKEQNLTADDLDFLGFVNEL